MDLYRSHILKPLFEDAVEHFADSLFLVQLAHLTMLKECGLLEEPDFVALHSTSREVAAQFKDSRPDYEERHEDLYFWFEDQLAQQLGAELAGRAHLARSRNDLDHTVFRMTLRRKLQALREQLLGLCQVLLERAEREQQRVVVAYTHGQPAQPTTLGHYLQAVLEVLLRRCQDLQRAAEVVDRCPMGAAAITTSGFPINRQRVAELLGFPALARNSYAAIAGVDYLSVTYSALRLTALDLGRWVNDMLFQTSFEVGTLRLDPSFIQISSIMPQKRNPVVLEHLRHLLSGVMGTCENVVSTLHNTPFTDINDSEGYNQVRGYPAFQRMEPVLTILTEIVRTLDIDDERVAEILGQSCCVLTELADTLVREEGLPFRQAHGIASRAAEHTLGEGGCSHQAIRQFFQEETGRASKLTDEALSRCLLADNFVQRRDRVGGPAQSALRASHLVYQEQLQELSRTLQQERSRVAQALESLST